MKQWHLVKHGRAFPEAARIPIRFPGAPSNEHLNALIHEFEAGTKLIALVDGVMVKLRHREFQVQPDLLRLWIIGLAPEHPALQGLKRWRRENS
ncbi:MAG: hypothetical protein ACFCD0_05235 [Gemmataceae bacterium]